MVNDMKKEIHRVFDKELNKWVIKRYDNHNPLNVYKHVEHADKFGEWFAEFDKSTFIKYGKDEIK